MNELQESEDFWIGLVEESIDLDWREAFVPIDCLSVDVALALAERLNLQLDIDVSEYIFHQSFTPNVMAQGSRVLH